MKKTILSAIVLAAFSFTVSAQGIIQWAKDIGTTNNEYPTKICSNNDGNSYVASAYSQTLIICNDMSGLYFVTIFDGKNTMTKKFTVIR
ncbi:MAG: hypothetical protein COX07_09640 [Bacteroidetes bacterium CG23_combo_of_CG06-09_8_20_14_all_32_9]|nr:MAG: hypothetical protein COX07_09640 [Bacteroidetes bacterium CG23_combo_of_CG06-09_8_20_14_all_32_9]